MLPRRGLACAAAIVVALALCASRVDAQCSVVSAAAGSWQTAATWVGGAVPNSNCNVTIAHTVKLDANVDLGTGILTIADAKHLNISYYELRAASISDAGASSTSLVSFDRGGALTCSRTGVRDPGGVIAGTLTFEPLWVSPDGAGQPRLQLSTTFTTTGVIQFVPAPAFSVHQNVSFAGGMWSGNINQGSLFFYVTADTWFNDVGAGWFGVQGISPGVTATLMGDGGRQFIVYGCQGTVAMRGQSPAVFFEFPDPFAQYIGSSATCIVDVGAVSNSIGGGYLPPLIRVAQGATGTVVIGVDQWNVAAGESVTIMNSLPGVTLSFVKDGNFHSDGGYFAFDGNVSFSGVMSFANDLTVWSGSGTAHFLTDSVTFANPATQVMATLKLVLAATRTATFNIGNGPAVSTQYGVLPALWFSRATVLIAGTTGGVVTVHDLPGMMTDSFLLVDSSTITLKLNGTLWRGYVGATANFGTGTIVFRDDPGYFVNSHPTDPLVLTGPSGVVTGTLNVPVGGSVVLGRPADAAASQQGLDLLGLVVKQATPASQRVSLCSSRIGISTLQGTGSLGVMGPLANCTTRLVMSNSDTVNLATISGWAGQLRIIDTACSVCRLVVTTVTTLEPAKLALQTGTIVLLEVTDLIIPAVFDYSGVGVTVQNSISNSLPSRPVRLPSGLEVVPAGGLTPSLCAVQCVFLGLTANSGLSYTVPANGAMYIQGTSSIASGGTGLLISQGATVEVTITSGVLLTYNLAHPTAVLRYAPDVSSATTVTGTGALVFIGTNQLIDLTATAIASTVMMQGPIAGAQLTVNAVSPVITNLTAWAGELVFNADPPAQLVGYMSTATAKLSLTNSAANVVFNECWMVAGSTVATVAPSSFTLINSNIQASFLNSDLTIVADFTSTSRVRLPTSGFALAALRVKANSALIVSNAVTLATLAVELNAGSSLSLATGVQGWATLHGVPDGALVLDGRASAAPIVISGVRLNCTGAITTKAPVPAQRINLWNGAGLAAVSVSALFSNPSGTPNQQLEVYTLDSSAAIGLMMSTATQSFTGYDEASPTTPFPAAKFILNTCVVAAGTFQAPVTITAPPQCAATNAFAGCNAVACNAASNARSGCTAARSTHTCSCVPGWIGAECQTNVDECASAPCQNGATCRDWVNYYNCTCPMGYTGRNCQTDINECGSNPCPAGSVCIDGINSYTCQTLVCPGAVGSDFCSAHGTCSNGLCSCNIGFSGLDCATPAPALPASQIELQVTNFNGATFPDALATFLGNAAANGSLTIVSTRTLSGGITVVVVSFTDVQDVNDLLSAVSRATAPAALGIQSARAGDGGVVAAGSGNNQSQSKPPISDNAAIGLVLAGLVIVIVVIALIWYCCANSRDHVDGPKTRVPTGSSADRNAVELQVR